ncbi:MAG TPA: response regulator transcription factor [Anaerolineales bacterium]
MTHILIVEDESEIAGYLRRGLAFEGYSAEIAANGLSALAAARERPPDLVVLDLMLPGVDGFEVARRLRAASDVPIIMLTARRDERDRIAGLEMGADDYLVKPFSPQELVSRVRAVLRRTRSRDQQASEKPVSFDGLEINPQTRLVTVQDREITLTAKEFDLLWLLVCHPRQVFTREQLLERVWGLSDFIDPSTVTVHVRRLREKIEADPSDPRYILTLWGVGYKFEP